MADRFNPTLKRRAYLLLTTGMAGLAGCGGSDDAGDGTSDTRTPAVQTATPTRTPTKTTTPERPSEPTDSDEGQDGGERETKQPVEPPDGTPILDRPVEQRLGATYVSPKYRFYEDEYDVVNEGASVLEELGCRVFKGWSYRMETQYPFHDWPTFDSQREVLQSDPFQNLLEREFDVYVFNSTAYTSGIDEGGWGYFVNRFTEQHETEVERAYKELTKYLLETYDGTGIEVVLSNWEGDWLFAGGAGEDGPLEPDALERAKRWWGARQRGIERARETVESDVAVLHAAEINRVFEAREDGVNWLVNTVLSDLPVDLVAYSAWDLCSAVAATDDFETEGRELVSETLDYVETKSPDPDEYVESVHGDDCRVVFPSEYGLAMRRNPIDESMRAIRAVTEEALAWGSPYALFWQTYDNEVLIDGDVVSVDENIENRLERAFEDGPGLDDVMGYHLVRPDSSRASTWYYFAEQLGTNEGEFARLDFEYDSLKLESDINPNVPEDRARRLGFACFDIEVSTHGEKAQFDVGILSEEPTYKRGVYTPEKTDEQHFRWFGGTEGVTTLYIPSASVSGANELETISLTGQAVDGGVDVDVYVDNNHRGTLSLDDRRDTYTHAL